VDRVILC